jgi:hypothetical protein
MFPHNVPEAVANLNATELPIPESLRQQGEGPALKFDGEKTRVDLLDPLALEGLAKVLTFGAKKYAAHNWRGGFKWSRLIGALMRHLFAIMRGEDIDPESSLPHIDHLGCCWMFLSWHMKTKSGVDDRWIEYPPK